MFFECQWLILSQAESICFLPPVGQGALKSVGIFLLTSKSSRAGPVLSVVYSFIAKYHRTGNICFKLFFLSFATFKKKSLKSRCLARYIAEQMVPNKLQSYGSQRPINSLEIQVQAFSHFLFQDKRYFCQETQQPSCMQLTSS